MCPNHDTSMSERNSVCMYLHIHIINRFIHSCIIVVVELLVNESLFAHVHQTNSPKSITH